GLAHLQWVENGAFGLVCHVLGAAVPELPAGVAPPGRVVVEVRAERRVRHTGAVAVAEETWDVARGRRRVLIRIGPRGRRLVTVLARLAGRLGQIRVEEQMLAQA